MIFFTTDALEGRNSVLQVHFPDLTVGGNPVDCEVHIDLKGNGLVFLANLWLAHGFRFGLTLKARKGASAAMFFDLTGRLCAW